MRTKLLGDDPHYRQHPDMAAVPEALRSAWSKVSFTGDWEPDDYARGHRVWPRMLALTKALWDGGVLLTAGSDLPNPWVVPGARSLHEELSLLADAGIPPLEVLRIATSNAARALGLDARIGSIEVGKEADLVLLDADPVGDLANTRTIVAVLNNGKLMAP